VACASSHQPGREAGEFLGALAVERDAIFAAVGFERREIKTFWFCRIFGIQFVNPLVQPVLLAFLLLDGSRALRFGGGQFFELFAGALGFGASSRALPANIWRTMPRIWSRISE